MEEQPLGRNTLRVRAMLKRKPDTPVRDIARRLDLSTQRVYQIIRTLERRGELK